MEVAIDTVMSTASTPSPILKSRKRPSKENEHASQPSKKVQIDDSRTSVCASAITDRMRNLFPEHDGVLSIPCKSARLFACFTLVAEQSYQGNLEEMRESRRGRATKHVKPLMPLLSALVHVEQTSLGSDVVNGAVTFSGFDCSSTQPPIDSLWGSIQHREAEIGSLSQALYQVHALLSNAENKEDVVACLQSMITFLRDMEKREGAELREECSKTMPAKWPSQRFKKASKTYRVDFETLVGIILSGNVARRSSPLNLEQHLAVSLGQAIRFYLRAFFNPVPWKLTPGNEAKEPLVKQSKLQSRISALLVMKLPEGVAVKDTAIADGEISAVFSMALVVVFSYFGADAFLSNEYQAPCIPDGFCTSDESLRGPGTKKKPMSKEEVEAVVSDIHAATSFRDAALACRFISNLMNFPGVCEEIAKVCGWVSIERHAKKIRQYELVKWCPEDAHLVLLSDTKRFFERIECYKAATEKMIAPCETRLEKIALKFKCGPKHKRAQQNNWALATIDAAMSKQFVFPAVVAQPQH